MASRRLTFEPGLTKSNYSQAIRILLVQTLDLALRLADGPAMPATNMESM